MRESIGRLRQACWVLSKLPAKTEAVEDACIALSLEVDRLNEALVIFNLSVKLDAVLSIVELVECPECGKAFTLGRKDQIDCGRKCGNRVRTRAFRARQSKKRHEIR